MLRQFTLLTFCTLLAPYTLSDIKIKKDAPSYNEEEVTVFEGKPCKVEIDKDVFEYGTISASSCVIKPNLNSGSHNDFEIIALPEERFSTYRPNYLAFLPNSDTTDKHLELYYSFKYRISDRKLFESYAFDNYAFLAYTGKFDFYWDSRPSSPVVNRLNNPELHYRVYFSASETAGDYVHKYLDIAFGHESNGQSITDSTAFTNFGEHAEDYVSRGWDYISLDYKFEINNRDDCGLLDFSCLYAHIYLRSFLQDGPLQGDIEDVIFWDTTIDAKITQFDGFRLILGKEYPFRKLNLFPTTGIWVDYRTGTEDAGQYSSWSLNLRKEVRLFDLKLPLYIRYFDGYGSEISSYHLRDRYLVLGLQFR